MLLVRAIHVGASVLSAGTFLFLLFVIGPSVREGEQAHVTGEEVKRWLWRLSGWSLFVALVSWLGGLGLVAANMSGRSLAQALAPEIVSTVLTSTTFGHVWMLRLALMALLAA